MLMRIRDNICHLNSFICEGRDVATIIICSSKNNHLNPLIKQIHHSNP